MFSIKKIAPFAALAALLVAPAATAAPDRVAGAAGGDAGTLLYPSIVNVPFTRIEAALTRAVKYTDTAQPDKAIAQLAIVRAQVKKAWRGEKYLIDNAPPPAPGDLAFESGAPVATSPFASAEDSGAQFFVVLSDVASTSQALAEAAKGTVQSALSTTIFATLNQRDASIKYIHDHQPPPPPGDVVADESGAPIAAGWSGVMPTVGDYVGDELQELDAMLENTALSAGSKRIFRAAELQDTKTQKTINALWPPVPGD